MDKTTFTIDEIMAAFDALKADLDENFGKGTGENNRFLIDDVAIDIKNFLVRGRHLADAPEREADDDETLFVGQNYSYFREEGW